MTTALTASVRRCRLIKNIYYKQSDITASLSELMMSPWALECDDTRRAGIQEALHLIQDMINGEVPESMKIPAADVVEVVRCKDCKKFVQNSDECPWDDESCDIWGNDYCSRGVRKEGKA